MQERNIPAEQTKVGSEALEAGLTCAEKLKGHLLEAQFLYSRSYSCLQPITGCSIARCAVTGSVSQYLCSGTLQYAT